MSRREFSKRTKRDGFLRASGRCEAILPNGDRCTCKLMPGKFTYDHRVPDFMGGEPTLANLQVICTPCDKAKYQTDRKTIDKTRRQSDAHAGITAPRRPIQSAPFAKTEKRHSATRPLTKRCALPTPIQRMTETAR